jgi:predicted Zn-dependent protease
MPEDTMEAIFAAALKHENAILLSVYGYYTINRRGNFSKGLALFKRAVRLSPREPQLWMNLIKLLIAMQEPAEAEENLRLFMSADTHGGNTTDYEKLQEAIDELRKPKPPAAQFGSSGDG